MFIGILGALLFMVALALLLIGLIQKVMKKPQLLATKKSIAMVVVGIVMFVYGLSLPVEETKTTLSNETNAKNEDVASPESASSEPTTAESVSSEPVVEQPSAPTVSREFRNALKKAESYLSHSSFSKAGLYHQLLYEGFPEDAAQYAVDNVITDWNVNALNKAISYLSHSAFSDQGLYHQLIYEGFTEEQAQYAIDNLPE